MKSRMMRLPRSVLVGEDAVENVVDVFNGLDLKGTALVIADTNTFDIAGERIETILKGSFTVLRRIVYDATMEEVKNVENILKERGCSFVVGVGGGKVIDVAKLSSKSAGIEFISVPTAAAHDGIASSRASIKHNSSTVSIEADAPIGIIADTKIIQKAPYRLLASGCGDIISKYTSIKDWELSRDENGEEFSEYAAALSIMSSKIIMDSRDTIREGGEESVRKVVKALISCGVAMSIAGSSRPASGSEHKFSHALDVVAPNSALHGEQCGIGTIMMMKLHGGDWQKIKRALSSIGAPTSARELGIADEHIVKALVKASEIRPERYTILEKVKLTHKEAEKLAADTKVIKN